MRRFHLFVVLMLIFGVVLSGCGGGQSGPTATPGSSNDPNNSGPSGGATAVAVNIGGEALPRGTLILTQMNNPIARTPDQQIIRLPDERFGSQASPDGRYSVRFVPANGLYDLQLVDYSATPTSTREVPEGKGLSGPGITWRHDSAGFAFFDFPVAGSAARASSRTIFYFEISNGQTKRLIADQPQGKAASSVAFSPDAKYLLYSVGDANAEGVGGPDSQPYMLDLATNQPMTLMPETLLGFSQWLGDSTGFLVLRADPATGASAVYVYRLSNIATPERLSPADGSDMLVDVSPDGKWIAVTSTIPGQTAQPTNVHVMSVNGGSRRALTKFTDVEQTITALIWSTDGIYYSLSNAVGNQDSTWRMDLDGTNASQIADGTLVGIVGAP